eukprot:3963882-Amphidinium_carterae.1
MAWTNLLTTANTPLLHSDDAPECRFEAARLLCFAPSAPLKASLPHHKRVNVSKRNNDTSIMTSDMY